MAELQDNDIVAAIIDGDHLIDDVFLITIALQLDRKVQYIPRSHFRRLLSESDISEEAKKCAQEALTAPALVCFDQDGEPYLPEDKPTEVTNG